MDIASLRIRIFRKKEKKALIYNPNSKELEAVKFSNEGFYIKLEFQKIDKTGFQNRLLFE